jgi:WD40 repeat protein
MDRSVLRFVCILCVPFCSTSVLQSQDVSWVKGGHSDDVNWVAFAPDGSYLAVSGWDGYIRFYDPTSLDVVRTFDEPSRPFMFDISKDGKYLAAGRYTISIWNAATGDRIKILKGHVGRVTSVALSPNGMYLVSASQDSTLRLWDTATGDSLATYLGHRGTIDAVEFSGDGGVFVSTGRDSTIRVWSVSGRNLVRTIWAGKQLGAAVISPDGSHIAAGVGDSTVTIWDAATGGIWKKFGPDLAIYRVRFSPDGKQIFSGGGLPTTVTVRDVATGSVLHNLDVGSQFLSMAISPDGRSIIHSSKLAKVWDVATGTLVSTVAGHTGRVTAVAISPSAGYCASGGEDAQVIVRTGVSGGWIRSFSLGTFNRVTGMAFSPDDHFIAAACQDDTVRLWNTGSWTSAMRVRGGYSGALAFSPDSKKLATRGSPEGSIQLWDVPNAAPGRSFAGLSGQPISVGFSPDGNQIAACNESPGTPAMQVWDVATGNVVIRFDLRTEGSLRSVAFSPDGSKIAGSRNDGVIRMWRTGSWDSLWTIHAGSPAMGFSPDGKYLVTGADSGRIRIWDAVTGDLLRVYGSDYGTQMVVAFAPDGRFILSGTGGGCVIRWGVGALTDVDQSRDRVRDGFVLSQNYPNPFNSTTVVSYQLPGPGDVRLVVFDVLGREVSFLVNESMGAGYHETEFDASNLPSGVYFYRLQTGGHVETKRLLLLR